MSRSADILIDDVLWLIFSFLPLEDVFNCETVCRRWRDVLSKQQLSWKRAFVRHLKSDGMEHSLWKRCAKHILHETMQWSTKGVNEGIPLSCQEISRSIFRVRRNWENGQFSVRTVDFLENNKPYSSSFGFDDFTFSWQLRNGNDDSFVVEPETMKLTRSEINFHFHNSNGRQTEYQWNPKYRGWVVKNHLGQRVKILFSTACQLDQFRRPRSPFTRKIIALDDIFFVHSRENESDEFFMWKINFSEKSPTFLKKNKFNCFRGLSLKNVDEKFVVAEENCFNIIFFSRENLKFHSSFTFCSPVFSYSNGLIFIVPKLDDLPNWENKDVHIIIIDVVSGFKSSLSLLLRTISRTPEMMFPEGNWVCSNEMVIVIGWNENVDDFEACYSILTFFDAKAVKSSIVPFVQQQPLFIPPLFEIQLCSFRLDQLWINQSEVVLFGQQYDNFENNVWRLIILKFSDLNVAELNPNFDLYDRFGMQLGIHNHSIFQLSSPLSDLEFQLGGMRRPSSCTNDQLQFDEIFPLRIFMHKRKYKDDNDAY